MEPIVKKSGVPIKVNLVLPIGTKTVTLPYRENNEYHVSDLSEAAGGAINIKNWRVRFAELHNPSTLVLFEGDIVWVNFDENIITNACATEDEDEDDEEPPEQIGWRYEETKHPRDMIMLALGHADYFVNHKFAEKYLNDIQDDLPHCVVTECAPLIKTLNDDVFFVDYLNDEYHEYMKQALDFYQRAFPMFQSSRPATRWLHSFYRPLIDLACLHRVGSNVGQPLQIHGQLLQSCSEETQNKFAAGMTPDLTDGWLFRYKSDTDATCLTPDNKLLPSVTTKAKEYSYQLGDDIFLLVDFLMELRKEDAKPNKFNAMIEAAGCLACFRPFISGTKVFFGTGDKTRVRFSFARDATDEENAKVITREIFSNSVCTFDSFLQTAAFLWRLKQYRLRQYRRWFGLTYFDRLLHHTGLQSLKNSSVPRNITDV